MRPGAGRPGSSGQLRPDNVNAAVGEHRWPPLLTLCSSRYRRGDPQIRAARLQLARTLLKLGADPNSGTPERETVRGYRTVLGAAVGRARHPRLVRLLLSSGAEAADGPTLYEGSAMWEAVRHHDRESLEALLAAEPRPPHWHLCHALPQALRHDDAELTRRLLRAGADPNWAMGAWGFGGNCLHEAVVLGVGPAVLEALLEHDAQVGFHDGTAAPRWRWRSVSAAARRPGCCARPVPGRGGARRRPLGRRLLCPRRRTGTQDAGGGHRGAATRGSPVAVPGCPQRRRAGGGAAAPGGADARAVDDDGQPAIHLAVLAGDAEGCRALLAGGADPWP